MILFILEDLSSHRICVYSFDKEQCDHPVLDSLNLHELLHIYFVFQSQLSLLIDFSESTSNRILSLIYLTLRKVKFTHNPIPWIVVYHKQYTIQCSIED